MRVLITGGCGFIGSNTAFRLMGKFSKVTILDNFSRDGAKENLTWLMEQGDVELIEADVRDNEAISKIISAGKYDAIIHLAAQVAVTTSVEDPKRDFEVNAMGTFNILESVRMYSPRTIVINASTNKVYGELGGLEPTEGLLRYELPELPMGVPENQSLDFHSPYGCSKGAADQYILDYARIYGLRTVNFRQSCIYGYRQFGIEDQGWVAWFTIAHLKKKPITVYGDGKQVRDLLFIDDLVDAYIAAIERIDEVRGMTFNIGGGPNVSVSLLEFIELLQEISGIPLEYAKGEWRPGDQRVYISDIRKAEIHLGWKPQINAVDGISKLHNWVKCNLDLFS